MRGAIKLHSGLFISHPHSPMDPRVWMCLLLLSAVVIGRDRVRERPPRTAQSSQARLTREERMAQREKLAEARNAPIRKQCMDAFHAQYEKNQSRVFIQVLGLHATGTNYAFKMLLNNGFDMGASPACSSVIGLSCLEHTFLWKHQDPNTIGMHPDFVYNASRVYFVIMIRHPFSWFVSTMRNPYDFNECKSYTATPCAFRSGGPCNTIPQKEREVWSNYTSRWAAWGEHYTRMFSSGHFRMHNATYVRFEDLTLDPDRQLDRIRNLARRRNVACSGNCASNQTWSILQKPAKLHGSKASHDQAISNIVKKPYLDTIPEAIARHMCTDEKTRHVMVVFEFLEECDLFSDS